MARTDPDEIAREVLDLEDGYTAAEWATVVRVIDALVAEACLRDVDPRQHAAECLVNPDSGALKDVPAVVVGKVAQLDLAMAMALVYIGRIG